MDRWTAFVLAEWVPTLEASGCRKKGPGRGPRDQGPGPRAGAHAGKDRRRDASPNYPKAFNSTVIQFNSKPFFEEAGEPARSNASWYYTIRFPRRESNIAM